MPWFRIDDSSHSHPKFVRAGNAALGLWVRCGAYSAQHLTEGRIPAEIVRVYGTAPQAKKLVKVGLWHTDGHSCDRCPQPEHPGDYVFHDFFEGGRNTTRAQHEASKQGAKQRKAKSVARQKAMRIEDESNSNRDRFDDENDANRDRKDPPFSDSDAGREGSSHRTPLEGGAPPHAMPCHAGPSLPTEEQDRAMLRAPAPDGVPDVLRALADALYHGGVRGIRWNLRGDEAFRVQNLIVHKGIEAMVITARNRQQKARGPIDTVTYFLGAWTELPNLPTGPPIGSGIPVLRPVQAPPSHTQNLIDGLRLLDEQEGLAR